MTNKIFPLEHSLTPVRQRLVSGAGAVVWMAFALLIAKPFVRADQIEMQNGDHYQGKVLSLNADVLVLQNDILGTVKLPRGKVAQITMGTAATVATTAQPPRTNALARAQLADGTNAPALSLPQLNTNVSSIQQVREQVLNGASPEAMAKFNELAGGLLTGKLSVADIRAQAKSAADQLRALKSDLGEDSGFAVDSYLAILDRFLGDAKSPAETGTNVPAQLPAKAPKVKSDPAEKEE